MLPHVLVLVSNVNLRDRGFVYSVKEPLVLYVCVH